MKISESSQERMVRSNPPFHDNHPKQVPFQERAFQLGNIIGVNAYRVHRASLKQRLTEIGYQVHETTHFLVGRKADAPTAVAHWFAPTAIDSDLGHYFMEELKPLGILANPQDFANVFGAVVNSVSPNDPQRAWHLFATNTLQRYHALLDGNQNAPPNCDSPVDVFATLYRRVCALHVGESLLDAGCSSGFLPLVVAERFPALTKVVGVDIRTEPFAVARLLAEERHLANVRFEQGDLLNDDLSSLGHFDTVTVLHVLEHFTTQIAFHPPSFMRGMKGVPCLGFGAGDMLTNCMVASILIYMDYQHEQHTVHLIVYHLIWCPKRRRKVLTGEVAERLEQIVRQVAQENAWEVISLAIQPDHVHLFLRANPYTLPTDIGRLIKGRSSHALREEFPRLMRMPSLWTRSTFYSTAGTLSAEIIEQYIERQSKV